jgi:mono/diheme cytochrome c family protein
MLRREGCRDMKRLAGGIALLVVIVAVAYVMLNRGDGSPGTAPVIAGAPASASLLARGEYLTKAADCVACHTVPESGKPFAGGVPFKLPFGTIYSSNITADLEQGIGAWSDDDFVRAVRDGVRKDGQHLYPAFPYTSYTRLSRDDVLAIKAYLFSLPTMDERNRRNDLGFPFNQRWAMGFWNAAFFKSQRFAADQSKSPEWNSGAYLATALQGWRAYNITSDTKSGIGGWSDDDIAQYVTTGHVDGHASASGPMGEAVAHSLQF